ncbi:dnaJ, partial [Symbiodinium microadriaticum]
MGQRLKQLESSWWRLRKQAVEQLTVAVKSGSHEAAAGVIKKLTNASSGIRLAAIEILSNMSSASFQELSVKAIQSLLDRLHDPVAEVRAAASKAFSFMAFSGGLDTPGLDVVTRTVALGTNEARRAAAQVLLSISEDHGDASKAEKAQQLAMIFSGLLVRALLAGDVSGTDAKNTILSILAQAAPKGHAAVEAGLVRVAKQDVDPSVRLAALDALRTVAGEGSRRLKEAALHLVLDEDDVVQEAAAELLETLDLTDYPESKEAETAEAVIMQTLPGGHPPPEEQVTMTEEQAKEIMMRYLERLGEQMRCGETTERSNAGEDEASPEEVAAIAAVEHLRQLLGPHLRDVERLRAGGRQMGVFLDGLHVTFVCPGSVAAEAGLLVGDTFCRMDDAEIMRQE